MNTWAVIRTGGKQYKVAEGDIVDVEKVKSDNKGEVLFNEILLAKKEVDLIIGQPLIKKAKVKAKVIQDFKDKKVRVVKFKAKSHYRKIQGHRQAKTKVLIEKIEF